MRKIKANYSIGEKIELFFSLIYTKIFWRKARLIRRPCHIRGKKGILYGTGLTVGYYSRINVSGDLSNIKLSIGKNCVIGDFIHIEANYHVEIGDNVLIASRVFISDTSHGSYNNVFSCLPQSAPNDRELFYKKTIIGDNVWIGENVVILPGVVIGSGAIVGAGAIVTKNVPDNSIVVGNPAKVIKGYSHDKCIWERSK